MNRSRCAAPVIASFRSGAIVLSVLLAGCAASRSTESFYALGAGGVAVTTASAASIGPVSLPGIVVSAVTVPELVDRPQIVTRDSFDRVVISEQNLWAEPVRSGIARTLARRLARTMLAAGEPVQVGAYPQTSITSPYVRITIDVVRFDAVPNGEAVVDALWSIRRVADDHVQTGRTVAVSPIAGTSYEAIVAAWNDALRTVARDIGANLVTIAVPQVDAGR